MFPGASQGWWVGWVVRDFTQGAGIWREEFLPRFENTDGVETNKSEMRITLPNGGGIFICTDKNIASLRGLGKRMKGLVVNEAAWFDLEYAWRSVLRAVLVDNMGWAMVMSTPNSGPDGNATGLTPSYFNRLCVDAHTGSLGDEWAVFSGDLRENPKIDPKEALAFLRELGEGSQQQAEEGYGQLIQTGAGLAFPTWNPKVHLVPWTERLPTDQPIVLGMDWGISTENQSAVVAMMVGAKGTLLGMREWSWTGKDAYEAGFEFAQDLLSSSLPRWPSQFVADSAMNERTGVGGSTILSEFQAGLDDALRTVNAPGLVVLPAPKGPGSRKAMFNQITKVLSWGPELKDGTVPASGMPRLQIMKDPTGVPLCPVLARDLASAPKKLGEDDVDKKKALFAAGDALGYLLAMVLPKTDPQVVVIPQDIHPGWLPNGQRRDRVRSPENVRREREIVYEIKAQQEGVELGGRYGRNPRR